MAAFLPKLVSGWHVDQAILAEESRVVVIRFGHDYVSLPFFRWILVCWPPSRIFASNVIEWSMYGSRWITVRYLGESKELCCHLWVSTLRLFERWRWVFANSVMFSFRHLRCYPSTRFHKGTSSRSLIISSRCARADRVREDVDVRIIRWLHDNVFLPFVFLFPTDLWYNILIVRG